LSLFTACKPAKKSKKGKKGKKRALLSEEEEDDESLQVRDLKGSSSTAKDEECLAECDLAAAECALTCLYEGPTFDQEVSKIELVRLRLHVVE